MKNKWFLVSSLVMLVVCGLFFSLIDVSYVQAATNVSGLINSDTVWTKANSPYNLSGDIIVDRAVTLTIEAGVTVNLNQFCIDINGTFVARGTETNLMTFNNSFAGEKGIIFEPASVGWNQSTGTGSIIEYAILESVGIFCRTATPRINHNIFVGGDIQPTYAIRFVPAQNGNPMVISNNTFCPGFAQSAIVINSGGSVPPVIINNNFISLRDVPNNPDDAFNVLSCNGSLDLNVTNNWWETTDLHFINQTIYDYYDDSYLGKVLFDPILLAPNNQALIFATSYAWQGGSITPSGRIFTSYGSNVTFTINADSGYHLTNVFFNGTSIGPVNHFTVENIQAIASISARFTADSAPTSTPSPTQNSTPSPSPSPTSPPTQNPTPSQTQSPSGGYNPTNTPTTPSLTPTVPELSSVALVAILLVGLAGAILFYRRSNYNRGP